MGKDIIYREDAIEALKGRENILHDAYTAVAIIRSIPSADRPQGEWIDKGRNLWGCSNCGMEIYSESEQDRNEFHKWCSRCGCRMKGADENCDYERAVEQMEYDMLYEPTYNPEDGSM